MTIKEQFHYGAVCGVQRETTCNFSGQENEVKMIFEVSEKNILVNVLDILFDEKLQITYRFRCNPL